MGVEMNEDVEKTRNEETRDEEEIPRFEVDGLTTDISELDVIINVISC